jgi:soluble lytic murein transglycosylase-like protein
VKRWRQPAALLLAWALAPAAQADLGGYVDARGVAHFAPQRVDSRFRLVLGDRAEALRVPGKTDGASPLLTWLEIAPQAKALWPWLREAEAAHGVDAELLQAVIVVESGFDARAISPRGAIGLMQITPATGDRYAAPGESARPAVERLLDPRINILTGARMLADLLRRHGRIELALAAWNAGEGALRRHGGVLPPIDETRAHVHLVLELYWALLQQRQAQRATAIRIQ